MNSSRRTQAPPSGVPEFTELTTRKLGPIRTFFVRHRWAMDLLIMGIYALSLLGGTLGDPALTETQSQISVLLILGSTIGLWWRRRSPVLLAVIFTVVTFFATWGMGYAPGLEPAIALALYCVATEYEPRRTWTLFVGVNAAVTATYLITDFTEYYQRSYDAMLAAIPDPDPIDLAAPWENFWFSTGSTFTVTLFAVLIGLNVRSRRLHLQTVIDRGNQLALERDQQAQLAVAAERSRIAREMHDVVAHSLSVMITLSEAAAVSMERTPEQARRAMDQTATTGREALSDMRRVLGMLREGEAAELSPQPQGDLTELVASFQRAGMPVRLTVAESALPADRTWQLNVYRIVQEALTNVLRHARAAPWIRVEVDRVGSDVRVEVVNALPDCPDPQKHKPITGSGRGLWGIRERVLLLGGQVEIERREREWSVSAVLPWPDTGAERNVQDLAGRVTSLNGLRGVRRSEWEMVGDRDGGEVVKEDQAGENGD